MTSQSQVEGELLFLTDSAYLSLIDEQYTRPSNGKQKHDGLFLERLDSFIEGQMRDMAAFANREQHSLDEIRKLVAVPHAKFLFSSQANNADDTSGGPSVRSTLARLSSTLQTLHSTAGLDSLLLVVASTPPVEPTTSFPTITETSWIGGTEFGKDFWMGLKGGGLAGVHAFRAKCRAAEETICTTSSMRSGDIKTQLNAAVRHALRTASGNPSAEMRWTRPTALEELYGVRVRGWPGGIVRRNPSNNNVRENRHLLECIRSGSMQFVTRGSSEWDAAALELEASHITGERSGTSGLQAPVPTNLPGSPHANSILESMSPPDGPTPSGYKVNLPQTAAKRTTGSEDAQDRRTRRRIDAETG